MKVNYVLMYGTPYLKYREFETFENISKFLVNKGICNYTIFEKMSDEKEVEMICLENDVKVLESRINKAIEYIIKSMNNPQPFYEYLYGDENGKVQNFDKLLNILKGELIK